MAYTIRQELDEIVSILDSGIINVGKIKERVINIERCLDVLESDAKGLQSDVEILLKTAETLSNKLY